jgi:hypothetical protein
MVVAGGPLGCGQSLWCDRLTCQRVYLRLMTRGLALGRRCGRSQFRRSVPAADGLPPQNLLTTLVRADGERWQGEAMPW